MTKQFKTRTVPGTYQVLAQMRQMTQIPAAGSAVVAAIYTYTMDYRNPVEEKGLHSHSLKRRAPVSALATPSRGEHPTLASGFFYFSRPLTSKKVLIYYAKVCFGSLSFADKGEGVTEYIKGGYLQCKRRNGPTGNVPDLEGLAQILGR